MKNKPILFVVLGLLFLILSSFVYTEFLMDKIEPKPITFHDDGSTEVAPYPPSFLHPLGSDRAGNDLALRMLEGAQVTITLIFGVTFLRLVFGSLFAYLLLFPLKRIRRFVQVFFTPFQYLPAFILVLIFSGNLLFLNKQIGYEQMILYQFLIIFFVGLPAIINTITNEASVVLKNDYITVSYLLGAKSARVFFKHIIPVLKQRLIIIFLQQLSINLLVLMHLGIFQYYIGGRKPNAVDLDQKKFLSQSGEWGGMIGEARNEIFQAPWIFFSPLLVCVVFIVALSFLIKKLEKNR